MVCTQQGWVFENSETDFDEWVSLRISVNKGQDIIDVGGRARLIMRHLVDSDDLPIVGEHHGMKYRRGQSLHRIHVATPKKDVVIQQRVDKFNVNEDSFSPEFDGDILKEPFRRGWSSIISSQHNGRWYQFRGVEFFPYSFGHDACGCTFINDASMNCDVPNFNWYLERYQSGEMRFPTIQIKCDESSISWVDYPHGGKQGFSLSWTGLEDLQD